VIDKIGLKGQAIPPSWVDQVREVELGGTVHRYLRSEDRPDLPRDNLITRKLLVEAALWNLEYIPENKEQDYDFDDLYDVDNIVVINPDSSSVFEELPELYIFSNSGALAARDYAKRTGHIILKFKKDLTKLIPLVHWYNEEQEIGHSGRILIEFHPDDIKLDETSSEEEEVDPGYYFYEPLGTLEDARKEFEEKEPPKQEYIPRDDAIDRIIEYGSLDIMTDMIRDNEFYADELDHGFLHDDEEEGSGEDLDIFGEESEDDTIKYRRSHKK